MNPRHVRYQFTLSSIAKTPHSSPSYTKSCHFGRSTLAARCAAANLDCTMPLSDEDLLKQIATGGKEAFGALYQRYSPRVYGLVLTLMKDRTEAEDVLQEVMWEVWRKAERYDPSTGSVPTWILMIARSRAVDSLRRGGRQRRLLNHVAPERAADSHDPATPDSLAAADSLSHALKDLPAEQATAIHLAYAHGLSRQQIADTTGVPIGTVKTRISLGIKRLNETIEVRSSSRLGSASTIERRCVHD